MFFFLNNDVAFNEIHIDVGDHHNCLPATIALSMQTAWKPDTTSPKSSFKVFMRHPLQIFLCRAVRKITSDSVCIVMLYTVYLVHVTCRNTYRKIDTALTYMRHAERYGSYMIYTCTRCAVYTHTHTRTRAYTHTHKQNVRVHTHTHTRARACAYAHTHIHVHI